MDNWNKHLKRIIWRFQGEKEIPEEYFPVFESISTAFDEYQKEYALLNRIMDLSSKELFEANELLRKRNEELDQFVYSASHDLRAPLTSIMGLLELIDLTEDQDEIKLYLEKMKVSTEQLDSFIQEIAAYTYNKKVGVRPESIDFEKLATSCIDRLRFMPNADKLEIRLRIDPSSNFKTDKQRLDNLISNLVSNSIKYCDLEKPDPFVCLEIKESSQSLEIHVRDNGIGILEKHLDKIYDMFYRASAKSKGSGIGLYIVKEIVDKLKGEIKVESKYGEGTNFTVLLPSLN